MSLLNLDLQVCHSLYSATNALVRAYRPLLEPLGLTYPQYLVMLSLWQQDGVSVKHLSEHTRFDSGTLTPILKRLEKQQLLVRAVSEEDERQKRISLTREGKKLKKQAEKIPEKIFCSMTEETSQKDVENAKKLKQLCEDLYKVLER